MLFWLDNPQTVTEVRLNRLGDLILSITFSNLVTLFFTKQLALKTICLN